MPKMTVWEQRFDNIGKLITGYDNAREILEAVYKAIDDGNGFGTIRVSESARAAMTRVVERIAAIPNTRCEGEVAEHWVKHEHGSPDHGECGYCGGHISDHANHGEDECPNACVYVGGQHVGHAGIEALDVGKRPDDDGMRS